jgi:hypothetical protein
MVPGCFLTVEPFQFSAAELVVYEGGSVLSNHKSIFIPQRTKQGKQQWIL